jgi:hypothetical protein
MQFSHVVKFISVVPGPHKMQAPVCPMSGAILPVGQATQAVVPLRSLSVNPGRHMAHMLVGYRPPTLCFPTNQVDIFSCEEQSGYAGADKE